MQRCIWLCGRAFADPFHSNEVIIMKHYTSPELVAHGNLTDITGVFGVSGADDVFIDEVGNDISDENDPGTPGGSIDGCAERDGICIGTGEPPSEL
jgi:hypothetical protein